MMHPPRDPRVCSANIDLPADKGNALVSRPQSPGACRLRSTIAAANITTQQKAFSLSVSGFLRKRNILLVIATFPYHSRLS